MVIRRIKLRNVIHALIGFAVLLACGIAAADPPARVARLANIGGAVSFSPAGEDEWVLATPNRPLITGDRVWADAGARAELQIGSLAVRLGSQTSLTILNLDDRVAQFQLAQGALNVRLRRIDPGQTIEVDTPLLAFSLRRPGDYRIDVDPASAATTVAVRSGEGEAYGDGAAYTIGERQWYRFADSGLRDYEYDALPPADAFDTWARDRDRREDRPVAARYVSPDVIGYSDLDDYGTWSAVEGYGNVWVPTSVASDWAPYHNGHWTWIEPWGWTWVDDAPWGFAPFHYGRWAYARERWCWVPGPVRVRPVYAPALVAFVGGSNFRITVGAGGPAQGIAWFPLAPGEVYRPAYRVSRNYFTNVNISNTNVTNIYVTDAYNKPDARNIVYRNRDQRGGMTAVPAAAFVQSRPVAQSAVPLSREAAKAAPVTAVAAIAPVRASVIGGRSGAAPGGAPAAGQGPPAAALQRPVMARVAPPPPPASFNAREAGLAKDPGRPADPATLGASRPAVTAAPIAPAVKVVVPATRGTPPPAPRVSRRPTSPAAPTAAGGTPATAPAAGMVPGTAAKPGAPVPAPQPASGVPSPLQTRPSSRVDAGGQAPKTDISPPPAPPTVRGPPPQPVPPVQAPPQPPKTMEMRPAPPPPSGIVPPAAAPTPPAEQRREPLPPVVKPPVAPKSPPAELRREPPPTPPAAVAKPPAAPLPPPAELRREPPPTPPPTVAKPPAPPSPPPAELRREPPPPPVAKPPPPASSPPPVARPPVVQPPPAAVPAPPAAVRQPEPKSKAESAKEEAQKAKEEAKAKADEKRDPQK